MVLNSESETAQVANESKAGVKVIALAATNSKQEPQKRVIPESKLDAESLRLIIELCLETHLFHDAEHALILYKKTDGDQFEELQQRIISARSVALENTKNTYGDGGVYRQVRVTK